MNPGRIILRNLAGGGGIARERLWALHPRAEEIDGCRAFPSLADLPEAADLAVVSVAADRGADQVVSEIVETRRARTVTLIAGGFGETEGGRAAEARVRAAALMQLNRQDDARAHVRRGLEIAQQRSLDYDAALLLELEANLQISEGVLRHLLVKLSI